LFSIATFLAGALLRVEQAIEAAGGKLESRISLLTQVINVEKSITHLLEAGSPPLVKDYLSWLSERYRNVLRLVPDGELAALDPDYFRFAELIFAQAKSSVLSSSLVDPYWYDGPRCRQYIANQVENIISKGKAYVRYFIVSKLDNDSRKSKTAGVILEQVKHGFDVVVVLVDDYGREQDVAIIDDGAFAMKADVPCDGPRPEAQIVGCRCYLGSAMVAGGQVPDQIKEIQGYFKKLDNKAVARFSGKSSDVSVFTELQKVYLDQTYV
jgi:hypothetical protein